MSRLTKGGDGSHWDGCWKTHYDCREKHFSDLLVRINATYDHFGCLGEVLTEVLREVVDDIGKLQDDNKK